MLFSMDIPHSENNVKGGLIALIYKQTSSSMVNSVCWHVLCLIDCFLSDEESLEIDWLWNHIKFRLQNTIVGTLP